MSVKFTRTIAVILSAMLVLNGCSSSNTSGSQAAASSQNDPNIDLIKKHSFITDYPDTPLEEVVNKFVNSPVWTIESENGVDKVSVKGTAKTIDKEFVISVLLNDDPEDQTQYQLDISLFRIGNLDCYTEETWDYMYDIYSEYANGYSDISRLYDMYMKSFSSALKEGFQWDETPAIYNTTKGPIALCGKITNLSHEPTYAKIQFNIYDKNDDLVGIASDEVSSINKGDTWSFLAELPISSDELGRWELKSFVTSPYEDEAFEKADINAMFDELSNNAMRAEAYYQDKLLEITGYVSTIDSDGKYFAIAGSDSSWDLDSITCYFTDDSQRQKFISKNKGDTITVRVKIKTIGEIIGYSADLVEIIK